MAVVWFVLRNENDIGFGYVREILDAWGNGVFGQKEFGVPHQRRPGEPWIHKNRKLSLWLLEIRRWREFLQWRKGEEKGGIAI